MFGLGVRNFLNGRPQGASFIVGASYAFAIGTGALGAMLCLYTTFFGREKYWHYPIYLSLATFFGITTSLLSAGVSKICAETRGDTDKWQWGGFFKQDICNRSKANFAFALMATTLLTLSGIVTLILAMNDKRTTGSWTKCKARSGGVDIEKGITQ